MIDEKLLQQAIKVLRDLNKKHYEDSSKKKPLLEDEKETTLYLQISLKKIPKCKSVKMIKVSLPHSLLRENSEVCLITGDLDKKCHKAEIEPDVLHYKELLKKHGVDRISEVVTLRQLRTEYKPYEAKQKLLAAYDVFLADRKIAECLPRVLGRHFFKKRKLPIQITINTPNLKQQVEKALSTKVFYVTGHGNSCNSEVAHLDMSVTEISENLTAMANVFCDKLPGSWNNIMGMYLKTSLSKAIPVYMSYDDPNNVELDEEIDDNSFEIDELSTLPNSFVKVYKDGSVKTARVKRMAQTEPVDNAIKGDEKTKEIGQKSSRKKIKKSNLTDVEEKTVTCPDLKEVIEGEEKTKDIGQKSSRKKIRKSNLIGVDKKTITCADLKEAIEGDEKPEDIGQKSSRKKIKKSNLIGVDKKTETCTDMKEAIEGDEKPEDIGQKSSRKKIKKSNLTDVEEKTVACPDLKGESNGITKRTRKSEGNMFMKEVTCAGLKEELPKEIGKTKSKRMSKKSMLSDSNRSIAFSPVQVVKTTKAEENLKTSSSIKGNKKGKQQKGTPCK